MKVLLMGAYGQANLGDEALLEVHLQQMRAHDVTVGSTDPEDTTRRYGVPAVSTRTDRLRAARALARADAVVFGGGSLLKELRPPHPRHQVVRNVAIAAAAARVAGKRVALSAMGAERLETPMGRWLARRAVGAADLLTLRDEGSHDLLRAVGVRRPLEVVADPVYLLEADEAAERRAREMLDACGSPKRLAVLNPMTSSEVPASYETVRDSFAEAARVLLEDGDTHVLLLPFKTAAPDDDVPVCEDVLRALGPSASASLAPLDMRPAEVLALLARADVFLGMRYHGILLAMSAGTTVLGVPYADKARHLVAEAGLAPVSVPADAMSPAALATLARRGREDARDVRDAVAKHLPGARALAAGNFARLGSVLAGGGA